MTENNSNKNRSTRRADPWTGNGGMVVLPREAGQTYYFGGDCCDCGTFVMLGPKGVHNVTKLRCSSCATARVIRS